MAQLTRDQLEALLQAPDSATDPTCLSIYLPTERKGAETQQNSIRFKNLVRQAEKALAEKGFEKAEVEELMDPLWRMVDDHDFWQHQEDGLAVFRSADRLDTFLLPVRFSELAIVQDHFYLKPLFALFRGDGRFYVLALSLHDVRLFSASRYSVREVELGEDVPRSLVEVVGGELEEPHLQFHSGSSGGGRAGSHSRAHSRAHGGPGGQGASPVYHGQGGGEDDTKPEIAKFFHRVDQTLGSYLDERNAPVVLAGVEYLLAIYREVSDLPELVEEGIPGNPEGLRPEQLHERAWDLVRPRLVARREKDAERFRELAAAGRGSSALEEIVPAAFDGRVETLFIARGERLWGRFDTETRQVILDDSPDPQADDLLDLAAVRTFMNGGTVYALETELLPTASNPVAAIFRY